MDRNLIKEYVRAPREAPVQDYYWMNRSELLEEIRQRGYRVRRTLPHERLVQLALGAQPMREEVSDTTETRARLQAVNMKYFNSVISQLPCKNGGELRAQCTVFNCTEMTHLDCFLEATQNGHLL